MTATYSLNGQGSIFTPMARGPSFMSTVENLNLSQDGNVTWLNFDVRCIVARPGGSLSLNGHFLQMVSSVYGEQAASHPAATYTWHLGGIESRPDVPITVDSVLDGLIPGNGDVGHVYLLRMTQINGELNLSDSQRAFVLELRQRVTHVFESTDYYQLAAEEINNVPPIVGPYDVVMV
jgi:hypothetical protein